MNEDILIERLVYRQQVANKKILEEIGKVLGEIGNLTPSQAYTIGQQLKYGGSLEKIIKILIDVSSLTETEIYELLEEEAKINLDFSKKYFKAKNIPFIPYEENIPLQNKVREIAITTMNRHRNIANTTGLTYLDRNGNKIIKDIRSAYNEIIDEGIMNVFTGQESMQQSLAQQLKTLGENGIRSIEYDSGYHRRIDSALRMNIKDGLNQLSIAQQQIVGEQFGNDGWEITTHTNPAPDHSNIQGHIFEDEEFKKLQDYDYYGEIKDINGNSYFRDAEEHIRTIGELNCYHRAFAIVIGVDKPIYTQEQLDKINEDNEKGIEYDGRHYTMYQATQMQRRMETEIRKAREEKITLKSAYEKNKSKEIKLELDTTNKHIKDLLNEYHNFSKSSELPTKLERTRVIN